MNIGQQIIMNEDNDPFWLKGDKAVITAEWQDGEYRADFSGNNTIYEDGSWCVNRDSFEVVK